MSGPPLASRQNNPRSFLLTVQPPEVVLLFWTLLCLSAASARAADLKPETVAAFNHYIAMTEAQMRSDTGAARFLIVDRLPDSQRQSAYDQLRQGQFYIEELQTQEDHHSIPIPNGLVHHWAGVAFIPRAKLSDVAAVLKDYDRQTDIYKPDLRQAKLLERHGDESKIFEQFYSKSIITVVLDVNFDVVETRFGSTRSEAVSRSTRIAEVADFGTPDEHERPVGRDHGYLWRLNSYWRMEEKDGGVYVQTQSVSLSRPVPVLLSWIVTPLMKSIPRDVLAHLLTNTRRAVEMRGTAAKPATLPGRAAAIHLPEAFLDDPRTR